MNDEAASESFSYWIKIPPIAYKHALQDYRLAMEDLQMQIDEKTKTSHAIESQIKEKKALMEILRDYHESVLDMDTNTRLLMDSMCNDKIFLESIIKKVRMAIDVDCAKIKELIHKIDPLKQHKKNSSSAERLMRIANMNEVRKHAGKSLQTVMEKLESLSVEAKETKEAIVKYKKSYEDNVKLVKELEAKYRDATEGRKAAITKKESYLNKMILLRACWWSAEFVHLHAKDAMVLSRYCKKNVEDFMKLWDEDQVFRNEYAKKGVTLQDF